MFQHKKFPQPAIGSDQHKCPCSIDGCVYFKVRLNLQYTINTVNALKAGILFFFLNVISYSELFFQKRDVIDNVSQYTVSTDWF